MRQHAAGGAVQTLAEKPHRPLFILFFLTSCRRLYSRDAALHYVELFRIRKLVEKCDFAREMRGEGGQWWGGGGMGRPWGNGRGWRESTL